MRRHLSASIAGSTQANAPRRGLFGLFCLCFLGLAAFLGSGASSVSAAGCPNEALRTGYGAYLPDCRAYEKATPEDKGEQDAPEVNQSGAIYDPQAAADGHRAAYFSQGAFSGSPAANSFYVSTRGRTDWSSQGIVPKQAVNTGVACIQGAIAYANDLSRVVLVDGGGGGFFGCGADDPPIVPGEPEGVANLFVRDSATGAYELVSLNPVAGKPAEAKLQGGSPDFSHVIFQEAAQLTADATSGKMLYDWSGGSVSLVGQVPTAPATSCSGSGCTTVADAELGGSLESNFSAVYRAARAVSADGSRVFFHATPEGGVDSLFLRKGDTTTQVDAAQGGTGPSGGGRFMTASADGNTVFFTAESKLTADSTATSGHPDLYRYDVGSGELTDVTVDTNPADVDGADVQGAVGASEDGSRIYYVATGVLAANANSQGDTAVSGEPNLYLLNGAATTYVATLADSDLTDWGIRTPNGVAGNAWTSRVTPDGRHVAFNSTLSLTGYDSTPLDPAACVDSAGNQSPCNEIFLYDADSGELECASCNPSGAPPLGASRIDGVKQHAVFFAGPRSDNISLPRNLSDDGGRVFFNSSDTLVPSDTNAKRDVYHYEDGQVHLISSGQGDDGSTFFDASSSGDSAFFVTREQLLPLDTDALLDLYDARVGGGLASQHPPPPEPPCAGESCRDAEAPPSTATAESPSFDGSGNVRVAGACSALARRTALAVRQARRVHRRALLLRRHLRRMPASRRAQRLRHRQRGLSRRAAKRARQAKRLRQSHRRCRQAHLKGSK